MTSQAGEWLDRIDAVEARLVALAIGPQPSGLTEPDKGGTERWTAGEVWAHIGEFGSFWLAQLDDVLAAPDPGAPFGRVKTDAGRVAAVAEGRSEAPAVHLERARRDMDKLRRLLEGLSPADWSKTGTHPTLGVMDVSRQLDEFLVGHWEEHADQLESIR
jgi:hypothetical protein